MDSKRVVNNFIWRLAERFGAQGVTFIVSIVLARILDPQVYGILALVTVFTSFLQVFVDSGLGTALIQKKDADDLDFSSVFFFNLCMCIVLYILVFLSAPLIAKFYKMTELVPVIRVLGVTIIISGVKNIQQAYVSRNLLFKKFFFATLGGTIGAAIIGILLALNGFGVWALVAQYLFNTFIDTVVLWISVKWRPRIMLSWDRLKSLLSFGWKLLGVSIFSTVYNNIRSLIIGKIYTTNDLAYYNKAQQLPQLLAINIDTAIDSVLLPTMSQRQDRVNEIKRMAKASISVETYIILPIMVGIAVCAEPLIEIVLTEKWLPCVPYLRLFCISFSMFSIFTTNYNAYKALGRSDIYLRVTIISKLVGMIILSSVMWFGVKAIAIGLVVGDLINQIICSIPSKKLYGYGYFEQLRDILPNALIAVVMGIMVFLIQFIKLPNWVTLLFQILSGVIIYLFLSYITRNKAFVFAYNRIFKRTQ